MTPAATRQADAHRLLERARMCTVDSVDALMSWNKGEYFRNIALEASAEAGKALTELGHFAFQLAVEVDKLASMIPAGGLAEEARWQPMETAPKVVGRIIGAVECRARFICWGKTSHVPLYGWILTDQGPEDADLCQPTAWMPLPDAAMASSTPQGKEKTR